MATMDLEVNLVVGEKRTAEGTSSQRRKRCNTKATQLKILNNRTTYDIELIDVEVGVSTEEVFNNF